MPRGRKQFTLSGLMILVAVCGFEAFKYRRSVEQKAEMKLAVSISDNIYLYSLGVVAFWVPFWVVASRVRAAKKEKGDGGNKLIYSLRPLFLF